MLKLIVSFGLTLVLSGCTQPAKFEVAKSVTPKLITPNTKYTAANPGKNPALEEKLFGAMTTEQYHTIYQLALARQYIKRCPGTRLDEKAEQKIFDELCGPNCDLSKPPYSEAVAYAFDSYNGGFKGANKKEICDVVTASYGPNGDYPVALPAKP